MVFRFRKIPFAATVLVVILGVAAGQWQLRRAAEKQALEDGMTAGAKQAPLVVGADAISATQAEFRRVKVSGEFVADWPVYLDNRPYRGRAGFYLLMPFKIAGTGQYVLVARGWLPRNLSDRTKMPPYGTPDGEITLEGIARSGAGHVMELGEQGALKPKAIVQNAGVTEMKAATGLPMQPFLIEQTRPASPHDMGLVRDWPAPAVGVEKHRGYALQWFSLAGLAVIFFVVTGFIRGKK